MPISKRCGFCGNTETSDNKVLETDNNSICFSCAETALFLFDTGLPETPNKEEIEHTPESIKEMFNEHVIGQEHPKKILSVAIYNHLKRIQNPHKDIEKTNILYRGKTGTGKTHLAKAASNNLDLPLAIVDATTLTSAGYVGDDINSIVKKLYYEADEDIEKTEKGIVFIDEMDKIAKSSPSGSRSKDIAGEAVQQGLLKVIEGSDVSFTIKDSLSMMEQNITINTENILFICSGSFPGLGEKSGEVNIQAFGVNKKEESNKLDIENFIDYGMIPELMGRLHLLSEFNDLGINDLIRILTEPKNSIINQYKNLFSLDGVQLEFTNNCLKQIAKQAIKRKTGARALRSIVENIILDYTYKIKHYKNKKISIDYKRNKYTPIIENIETEQKGNLQLEA